MKNLNGFYETKEVDLERIAPVYQSAFADDPWFEVSKCPSEKLEDCCPNGFSRCPVGETCPKGYLVREVAYPTAELVKNFEKYQDGLWYIEFVDKDLALAALAWRANAKEIFAKKYQNNPNMQQWLSAKIPGEVVWLDEVFRDKSVRPRKNLANFETMVNGYMEKFDTELLAYRTISPAMLKKPQTVFPDKSTIFNRKVDLPDWRDFVIIERSKK
jgi:hypothetical protein